MSLCEADAESQDLEKSLSDLLLVVHDDLDLPWGKLRFRESGASGGHRGMASLIEALGTEGLGRLKVGIGRREGSDAAEYVLEPLRGEGAEQLLNVAAHAAKTLPVWIEHGIQTCANQFNGSVGELSVES